LANERTSAAIELHEEGATSEELDRLTDRLRRELLDLDVDRVRKPSSGEAPPGARGIELAAIGALILEFGRSAKTLSTVIAAIQSWLGGHGNRSIKIEMDGDKLEIAGASTEEQQRLITAWIDRHANE
jgi:hypothetical protein